jgi:hypothetical protein
MSVARALKDAEATGSLSMRGFGLKLFPATEGYMLEEVTDLGVLFPQSGPAFA